ncbi:hypothetical protein D3C80_2179120 [compost metagenome]
MAPRVVANEMPFADHPLQQLRLCFDIVASYEENRGYLLLLQHIQNTGSQTILIAIVEG